MFSTSVLIGILVAVLLVLLVVLLVLNRRSGAKAQVRPVAPAPAAFAAAANAAAPPIAGPAPAEPPFSPAPALRPSTAGRSDPVRTAVVSLLDGQGALTPSETRRLELYRPERVLEVVDELEPTYTGKGREQSRARLGRIRKYAQDFLEDLPVTGAAAAIDPVSLGVAAFAAAESPAAGADGAAYAGPFTAGVGADTAPTDGSAAGGEWPPAAREAIDDDTTAETVVAADHVTPGEDGASTETSSAVGAAAQQTPPLAHNLWAVPAYADEPPEEPPTSDALQSLDVDISTAEDLLSLPRSEQVDALSFLDTEQLGRTFALADDPQLKRAAIDMLEQDGSSEALAAIQTCFEDPDPELQAYAVDAAERLLARRGNAS